MSVFCFQRNNRSVLGYVCAGSSKSRANLFQSRYVATSGRHAVVDVLLETVDAYALGSTVLTYVLYLVSRSIYVHEFAGDCSLLHLTSER